MKKCERSGCKATEHGWASRTNPEKPEGLMLVVGWDYAAFPDVHDIVVHRGRTLVHMRDETLDPPLTNEEMQEIAGAAKMACAKVLRARARAKRGAK